jgi:hypothetical protein
MIILKNISSQNNTGLAGGGGFGLLVLIMI